MDKDFQTTFIPKKPLAKKEESTASAKPISLVSFIGIVVFAAAVVAGVGVFLLEGLVKKRIESKTESLEIARKQFEPALIIELQELDQRLESADELLSGHTAMSAVFRFLEDTTLRDVRFTDFSYDAMNNPSAMSLKGAARSYTAIALQSRAFGESREVNDHIFSEFKLDDFGNVTFSLALSVDPNLITFVDRVQKESFADSLSVNDSGSDGPLPDSAVTPES